MTLLSTKGKGPTIIPVKTWKDIHCSGCTDPDPLGGTHCYGNIEHGPEPLGYSDIPVKPVTSISKHTSLSKNNRIHKEGFDAGYKAGYKMALKECVKVNDCGYCKMELLDL